MEMAVNFPLCQGDKFCQDMSKVKWRESEDGGERQNYGGRLTSGWFRVGDKQLETVRPGRFCRGRIVSKGYRWKMHILSWKKMTRVEWLGNYNILGVILFTWKSVCTGIADVQESLFLLSPSHAEWQKPSAGDKFPGLGAPGRHAADLQDDSARWGTRCPWLRDNLQHHQGPAKTR